MLTTLFLRPLIVRITADDYGNIALEYALIAAVFSITLTLLIPPITDLVIMTLQETKAGLQ